MTQTYYLTTTIPYVNGSPHIGHAEEFVQSDTFGRYHRLRGDDTYVLTGTDENALKNVQAADKEGISPRELVDRNSRRFQDLANRLSFSYDQFIRTAIDPRHAAGVAKLWGLVDHAGDIYKKHYRGLYCVGCEQFYDEVELENGLCPEHLVAPEAVEEENYFFRLSRYADQLYELISSDRLHIIPLTRKNEVLSFISRGLQDFSISRSEQRARGWGIRVPGDPSQVIYVWFDALTNYITALDYAQDGALYRKYWQENPQRVHALGKGVIRFHAIYWPAMLLSAGLPLPHTEFVHGYINIGGTKISKSLGNSIDPEALIDEYGSEAVRYYLLRAVPATGDHNFTYENLEARYNADLANDLGNLLNRAVSMIGRYRQGQVPPVRAAGDLEGELQAVAAGIPARIDQAMERYDPAAALEAIWELVTRANRYVEETAPWALAKAARHGDADAEARLDTALATLAEAVRLLAAFLEPFLPITAERMRAQLGVPLEHSWPQRIQWGAWPAGTRVGQAEPLFPRLLAATAS